MKQTILTLLLLGGSTFARAYEHYDNPAYCFGFLKAKAENSAAPLIWTKKNAQNLFGKAGPKDSTDERNFNDWVKIGYADYAIISDEDRLLYLHGCKEWFEKFDR